MTSQTLAQRFDQLGLLQPILRAIDEAGHTTPTPVQARAIQPALEGRDILACAQTGTGKTAAFALPILQRLSQSSAGRGRLRALILSPTRELAAQILADFQRYGRYLRLGYVAVYGGVSQRPQVSALRDGIDVLVATPGRLWDLIEQRLVDLRDVEVLVLDEADRMLDQGFLPVVRRILGVLPREHQTLFFSATMPDALRPLVGATLHDPVRVDASSPATTPEAIDQCVYFVDQRDKRSLLQHVLGDDAITRAIVFTRTKHGADRVAKHLGQLRVSTAAIHGNKSQGARERALAAFKSGTIRVLVATDLAARGIDVADVSHVINFDLPAEAEAYVHRIGRTARAGASGRAISFCSADERPGLAKIERLTRKRVAVVSKHPYC